MRGPSRRLPVDAAQRQLARAVAADEVVRRDLFLLRRLLAADRLRVVAARVEVAAGRRVGRVGDVALQHDAVGAQPRIGLGHRRQQRLGVRVPGRREQLLGGRHLHDPADVHHRDAVADVLDHRQVVRDEEVGEPQLVLQLEQQVEDLRLHRDVERRHRLVGDDQPRIERQRAGDADALPLAAGERVRVAAHVLGPQADQLAAARRRGRCAPARCRCRGPAAARRRCRAASCAGSATRTDPGRSSASAAAAAAARPSAAWRRRRPGLPRAAAARPRSGRSRAGCSATSSSCRSRSRRPATASRPC